MPESQTAEVVPADRYKPLLPKGRREAALAMLRSGETLAKAGRMVAMRRAELRDAVLDLVDQMDLTARGGDWPAAFAAAHEIRGLAATAGLTATGRIANGLCQYLDAVEMLRAVPDAAVAGLHIDAIVRSARTEDDTARHGNAVAEQLSALVSRKLAEIKG
jgi:hypothetical protein